MFQSYFFSLTSISNYTKGVIWQCFAAIYVIYISHSTNKYLRIFFYLARVLPKRFRNILVWIEPGGFSNYYALILNALILYALRSIAIFFSKYFVVGINIAIVNLNIGFNKKVKRKDLNNESI